MTDLTKYEKMLEIFKKSLKSKIKWLLSVFG